jgi:hypothetical protein
MAEGSIKLPSVTNSPAKVVNEEIDSLNIDNPPSKKELQIPQVNQYSDVNVQSKYQSIIDRNPFESFKGPTKKTDNYILQDNPPSEDGVPISDETFTIMTKYDTELANRIENDPDYYNITNNIPSVAANKIPELLNIDYSNRAKQLLSNIKFSKFEKKDDGKIYANIVTDDGINLDTQDWVKFNENLSDPSTYSNYELEQDFNRGEFAYEIDMDPESPTYLQPMIYSRDQERQIQKFQDKLKENGLRHDREYAVFIMANNNKLPLRPFDFYDMKVRVGLREDIFEDVYEITDDDEYKIDIEKAKLELIQQSKEYNNELMLASFGNVKVMGSEKIGKFIEQQYQDNPVFTFYMSVGEVTFDDVGGLINLFGGSEDNIASKQARKWQTITQKGITEALLIGDKSLYWGRSLNGIGSDMFGNIIVLQKWIKLINGWKGGKSLSLVAKGKTYKELFKTVSLRSMFMSAYTYVTTNGSQEERREAALWAMAYSMTPAISSLSKGDWRAIGKDIIINGLMTASDLDNRVVKPAQQETESIYGSRTTENSKEWDEAYSSFYATRMVAAFTPDVVFGLFTRAVQGDTRLPSKIPLIGGWQFPSKALQGPNINNKTKSTLIKQKVNQLKDNQVLKETEGILNLILNGKPIKQDFSANIKDPEQVTNTTPMSRVRFIAKIYNIKTGGRKKVDIVADINKAQKKINLGQQFNKELNNIKRKATNEAKKTMPPKKASDKADPGAKQIKSLDEIKRIVKTPFTLLKRYNEVFKLMTYRADDMDGGLGKQKGFFHNIYVKNINNGWANYHRNLEIRQNGFIKLLNTLKVSQGLLNKRFQYHKDMTLRLSELIGIYVKVRQKGGYEAILKNNFVVGDPKKKMYDTAALNSAIQFVANVPTYKKIGDYLLLDYAKNYGRLRQTYEAITGKKLEVVDFYAPLFRVGEIDAKLRDIDDTTKLMETPLGQIFKGDSKKKGRSVSTQSTFNRTEDARGKVDLDIVGEWWRTISSQEYYIAQAKNVKTMDAVTKKIGKQYAEKFGRNELDAVKKYISIAANPYKMWSSLDLNARELEKMSRFLRQNFSIAYLSYNTTVMLKQIPSILFFLQELGGTREGLGRLFTSLGRITLGTRIEFKKVKGANIPYLGNALMRTLQTLDPILKSTNPNREIEEMRTSNPRVYNKFINGFQNVKNTNARIGFMGILFFDKIVRHAGFDAILNKALQGGADVDTAISVARDAIGRSQPTNRATDLANIYANGGEPARWLLQFSNQLLKIQNMIYNQLPRLMKVENLKTVEGREKLSGLICSLAVTSIYMWTVTNGRLPETDEEFLDAIINQLAAGSGPVGSIVGQTRQGYDYNLPIGELATETIETFEKVFDDDINTNWGWRDFDETLGGVGGIPTTALNRAKKYGESGDLKDLLWKQPKPTQGYETPRLDGFENISPFPDVDPF